MAGRDSAGNVSFPTGTPVVSGTNISSAQMNALFEMFRYEIERSLSRDGLGGLLQPLRLTDGATAGPALSFTSETGSGWYRAGSGDVRLARLGVDVMKATAAGLGAVVWGALTATSAILRGAVADGASAVGTILDNSVTLANATAKLLSIRNNGSEAAYFDKGGNLYSDNIFALAAARLGLIGRDADDASAVAVAVDNIPALTTSGAKLLSVRNNGVEKFYVDKDGGIFPAVASTTATAAANWTMGTNIVRRSAGVVFASTSVTAGVGAAWSSICTLPAGFRPNAAIRVYGDVLQSASLYPAAFSVGTDGSVQCIFVHDGTSYVTPTGPSSGNVARFTISFVV